MITSNDKIGFDLSKAGLYVHIPFCVQKCNYCAFLSGPADEGTRQLYVDNIIREIEMRAEPDKECDTVFFGGGTPSLLTADQIRCILDALKRSFHICVDSEITIEANPATIDEAKLISYRELGINRLSIGVQSFNDEHLKVLGRIHTAEDAVRDIELARKAGFDNINIDLMFSIPGSTVDEAMESLRKGISLGPDHISYYSLQLEEGTKFFKDFEAGLLDQVSDEDDREMYHRGRMLLKDSGYIHYEFSNFAKPGHISRHNSKYWSMTDYLGFGLGASSYENGTRIMNTASRTEYMHKTESGKLPFDDVHRNSERDNISEAVFTGLRRNFGIVFSEILGSKEAFFDYYSDIRDELMEFERYGYLIIDDEGMTLTNMGIDISNRIMALFV